MNLYIELESAFRAAGDAPVFFLPGGEDWSYARLLAATESMAGALAGLGVGAEARVLVQVPKTPQAVALYLACLKIGAIYAPVNPAYTAAEVGHFLADLQPALWVAESSQASRDVNASVRVETLDAEGGGSLAALAAASGIRPATAASTPEQVAAIIYTSGTTGRAKGAMLTHGNLASNARALIACWGWRPDDVLLHALPIFHVHGLFVALHCAFLTGTPMLFLPAFDVAQVLRLLPRATVLMGVPTFYTRLLAAPAFDATLCRAMRLFISGSAPLAEQTFAAFEQRVGQRILERYGMSETLMNTSNPLRGERIAGTVGRPLPGVEVRVVDDDGAPLPAGAVGGLEVRGANVFKGYWRMPDATREHFRGDGFFVTGDLGALDANGRLTLVGRATDLIITGGYNVYPKEVETALEELPGVIESAVFGVPHPDFGEAVVAAVVAEGEVAPARVDAFLKQRLVRYKQPKQLLQVDALPRNAMGKVQKNALRNAYRGLFS